MITSDGMKYISQMKCLRRLTLASLRHRRVDDEVSSDSDDSNDSNDDGNDGGVMILATSGVLSRLESLSVVGISDESMELIAPCTRRRSVNDGNCLC